MERFRTIRKVRGVIKRKTKKFGVDADLKIPEEKDYRIMLPKILEAKR
jgi:hypothetical protein